MSEIRPEDRGGIDGGSEDWPEWADDDIVILAADAGPEAWIRVWRTGLVPQLSTSGLEALRQALLRDDPRICTGSTSVPPPLQAFGDEPVERCCPLAYAIVGKDRSYYSVSMLDQHFAETAARCDELTGQPCSIRYFLNAVDSWSRPQLIANLLPEVEKVLVERSNGQACQEMSPLAKQLLASIRLAEQGIQA